MKKEILLYGALGGVLIALLKLIDVLQSSFGKTVLRLLTFMTKAVADQGLQLLDLAHGFEYEYESEYETELFLEL